MKKLNKESVFDTLMNHLMGETDGDKMLEECMTFDVKKTKKIPMRYRMIALGFANMWLAVFADVGVMILAVLNAVRALFVKRL